MRRNSLVITLFFALATGTAFCQAPLPQGGQPGQQQRQGANQAGRAAFSNNQGNAAQGAGDAAYMQQVSYGIGRDFAMRLRENEIQLDMQSLMAGISDVFRGAQPKWSQQELDTVLQRFNKEMQQKAMTEMQQVSAKNHREAENFLAQNARAQGVQTTPSGLQYRVIQQGNGASPVVGDKVRCNYKGTLLNGTEFDNSQKHGGPAELSVDRVIDGWKEALQKMHVGDKWQLFVPPKLAYDMNPPTPTIEPGSLLVFELELLDIVKK
jgi:FKBP-type peptidyl-prolyl cis-trans isomerase